jgi:integrase/recombinase XerD
MKLKAVVCNYAAYRRAMGEKFRTNECILNAFCKCMGTDIDIEGVSAEKVAEFLYGNGPVTSSWFCKHTALVGFYEYTISRGYINSSPLPMVLPKRPPKFVPYIYTREELRQLLQASLTFQKRRTHIEPYMVNKILLVLYGTGLRISEALSLTMADVDLHQAIIIVRQTKFFKSRLVPFGNQLAEVIKEYIGWREQKGFPQVENAPFFLRTKW